MIDVLIIIAYSLIALATSIPLVREELVWRVGEDGEIKARMRRNCIGETELGFIILASIFWPITFAATAIYVAITFIANRAFVKNLWRGKPPQEIKEKQLDKLLEPSKVD